MNKILTILLLISVPFFVYTKDYSKSDIIGKWTAEEITMVNVDSISSTPDEKKIMEEVMNGFKDSKYIFHSDGRFNIEFKSGIPKSMNDLEFLNNRNWIFDNNNIYISTGTVKDKYPLMIILVIAKNDHTYFALSETPFIMKMSKE